MVRKRIAKGVPEGGQFAVQDKANEMSTSGLSLSKDPLENTTLDFVVYGVPVSWDRENNKWKSVKTIANLPIYQKFADIDSKQAKVVIALSSILAAVSNRGYIKIENYGEAELSIVELSRWVLDKGINAEEISYSDMADKNYPMLASYMLSIQEHFNRLTHRYGKELPESPSSGGDIPMIIHRLSDPRKAIDTGNRVCNQFLDYFCLTPADPEISPHVKSNLWSSHPYPRQVPTVDEFHDYRKQFFENADTVMSTHAGFLFVTSLLDENDFRDQRTILNTEPYGPLGNTYALECFLEAMDKGDEQAREVGVWLLRRMVSKADGEDSDGLDYVSEEIHQGIRNLLSKYKDKILKSHERDYGTYPVWSIQIKKWEAAERKINKWLQHALTTPETTYSNQAMVSAFQTFLIKRRREELAS